MPGFGKQDPNPFGLGIEVRGTKSPHWTATTGSERTYGHFGMRGTAFWIDPEADTPSSSAPPTTSATRTARSCPASATPCSPRTADAIASRKTPGRRRADETPRPAPRAEGAATCSTTGS